MQRQRGKLPLVVIVSPAQRHPAERNRKLLVEAEPGHSGTGQHQRPVAHQLMIDVLVHAERRVERRHLVEGEARLEQEQTGFVGVVDAQKRAVVFRVERDPVAGGVARRAKRRFGQRHMVDLRAKLLRRQNILAPPRPDGEISAAPAHADRLHDRAGGQRLARLSRHRRDDDHPFSAPNQSVNDAAAAQDGVIQMRRQEQVNAHGSLFRRSDREGERAAYVNLTFHLDLAAHLLDEVGGDGVAQARARLRARVVVVGAPELRPQLPDRLARHADARIADAEFDPVVHLARAQRDRAAVGRVFVGVAGEVGQHLQQAIVIDPHVGQVGFDLLDVGVITAADLRHDGVAHALDDVHDGDARLVHEEMPAFDAADVRQIGDEHFHALDRIADTVQEVDLPLLQIAVHQRQVGVAEDAGHRHFEVVGDDADKFAFGAVGGLHRRVQPRVFDGDGSPRDDALDHFLLLFAEGAALSQDDHGEDLLLAAHRHDQHAVSAPLVVDQHRLARLTTSIAAGKVFSRKIGSVSSSSMP